MIENKNQTIVFCIKKRVSLHPQFRKNVLCISSELITGSGLFP